MEIIKFMLLLTAKLLVLIVSSFIIGFTPMVVLGLLNKFLGNFSFYEFFQSSPVIVINFILSVVAGILLYNITTEQFTKE